MKAQSGLTQYGLVIFDLTDDLVPVLEVELVGGRIDDDMQALGPERGHPPLQKSNVPLDLGYVLVGDRLVPAARGPHRDLPQADDVGRPEDGQETEMDERGRGAEQALGRHVISP